MADRRGSKTVDIPGTSHMGRNKPNKSEKTRRGWSLREEKFLLASFKELIATGWKTDNGWYNVKLEEAMRWEFPNTDIRAIPHIVSKITTWKKSYYSLQGILSRSGIGFNNDGDYRIECEDEQWEQIVKVDGNARSMRNKPWPYWEEWKEIFGHDRANGKNAEDALDIVNELDEHDNIGNMGIGGDYHVNLEDVFGNENVQDSVANDAEEDKPSQGKRDNPPLKQPSKKRKVSDEMDAFYNLFSKMHEDSNSRLEVLSNKIGHEDDLSKARKEVYNHLGGISGLTIDDKFDVCDVLIKETDKLDFFMGLPDDARSVYVMRILKKK